MSRRQRILALAIGLCSLYFLLVCVTSGKSDLVLLDPDTATPAALSKDSVAEISSWWKVAGPEPEPKPREQPCKCFSLCNPDEVIRFRRSLPDTVTSTASPWYQYLQAVYLGPVPLPFDLRRLNYFYHNDDLWYRKNPKVEWPMATCDMSLTRRVVGFRRSADPNVQASNWTACNASVCARWQLPEPRREKTRYVFNVFMGDGAEGNGTSRATIFFDANRTGVGRQLVPDGAWLEVTRTGESMEGRNDYGCWFVPAWGSGLSIQMNRSYHLGYKYNERGQFAWAQGELYQAWAKRKGVASPEEAERLLPARRPPKEHFQFFAYEMGFRSVQVAYGWWGLTEVVVMPDVCMKRETPVFTGPCAPVAVRRGWQNDKPCKCDDGQGSLNCGG